MNGGDFDGGYIDIVSEGNVTLTGALSANAVTGEGFGGEITITVDGNITVERGAKILARGHKSAQNYGGDGGTIELYADGDVILEPKTKIDLRGGRPDGYGGDARLETIGSVEIAGHIHV